jgi:catechol 2,3-dioxygenase-like lactoylglutathione lyase family enzyme
MAAQFLHVGISVRNLEESIRFYRDVMGMEEEYRTVNRGAKISRVVGVKNAHMDVCVLKKGVVRLELLAYKNSARGKEKRYRSQDEPGLAHIAFQVDDVDREYERIIGLGFEAYAPPMVAREGGPKITYVRGPDNVIVELFEKREDSADGESAN